MRRRHTSIIVLGYGDEDYLEACLAAVSDDLPAEDELILVDNGIARLAERRASFPRVRVIGDGTNLGFAGGCNLGARKSTGDRLVFLNSDAIAEKGAVRELAAELDDAQLGIASGCLLLADRPDEVNTVGNPIQYLGITWAGACGEQYGLHRERRQITCATGGFFAIRRDLWEQLGGFEETYFAYHEDTDLSLRTQHLGYRIDYIPTARARHHYEFSRNPRKMFLLERNRLLLVLTDYPQQVRRRVLPMLIATEPLFFVLSILQGWFPQKLRAWWWIVRHPSLLRSIRRRVFSGPTLRSEQFADLLVSRIEPTGAPTPPGMPLVNAVLAAYWKLARPR